MSKTVAIRWLLVLVIDSLCFSAHSAGFAFRHHFIDTDLPGDSWGQTALADLDQDGRLEFITGQKGGPIHWYVRNAEGAWVRRVLGDKSPSDVGGAVWDVDGDGWLDFVAGGVWYRNPGPPTTKPFARFVFDESLTQVHDIAVADLTGDGRAEILTMSDKNNLRYYIIPENPQAPWNRRDIGASVHAGIEVGDIDGDGDLDVVRSNIWMENVNGDGTKWKPHENIPFGEPAPPYPLATRCRARDMDGDGDLDLIMTENEIRDGAIAWLENRDGRGGNWLRHNLPFGDDSPRGAFHSLAVEDFDNDGDWDVFSCEMEGISGDKQPRWFLWENTDGKGKSFVEHVILDSKLGGHEAVVADVDGDGDLDICAKLWRPRPDNANGGRNHADFLENQQVSASDEP